MVTVLLRYVTYSNNVKLATISNIHLGWMYLDITPPNMVNTVSNTLALYYGITCVYLSRAAQT